jgi:hypothetical protein
MESATPPFMVMVRESAEVSGIIAIQRSDS